jgi:hypothetical protein
MERAGGSTWALSTNRFRFIGKTVAPGVVYRKIETDYAEKQLLKP